MELIISEEAYVILGGPSHNGTAIFCNRISGSLSITHSSVLCELKHTNCLGRFDCFLGKIPPSASDDIPYLLIATKTSSVGFHPFTLHEIFRIHTVAAFPLAPDTILHNEDWRNKAELRKCEKHSAHDTSIISNSGLAFFQKGQSKILKGTADSVKFLSNKGLNIKNTKSSKSQEYAKISETSNRKLLDEILRLFNEQDCFYFCSPGGDLTNSLQRLSTIKSRSFTDYDTRFYWNKYLLQDLFQHCSDPATLSPWIVPVIQGFVAVEYCSLDTYDTGEAELVLISRRSVYRAGTRYIKRGIDAEGHVANYVETEQIFKCGGHCLSFVQIRGSVPVYWIQSGYKYRPPPRINKPKEESLLAYNKHTSEQIATYGSPLVMVNVVDQSGREASLGEAFLDHVIDSDSDSMVYVAFDFHDHCRGLRFDRLSVLVEALADCLKDIRFSWLDKKGVLVCHQNGVIRVNCVDCLDRTNVVQTAIAKTVLESQLLKMGFLNPEESLSYRLLVPFQHMWADNGDSISHQYAGTAALKGDFTRKGQRNLAGLFRDGYHSASRYYLCHMRDTRRQAGINALLGKTAENEAIIASNEGQIDQASNGEAAEKIHEDLRLLVQECKKYYVPETEILLGGWALIDADPGTGENFSVTDMDTVIVLTKNAYYCTEYDEDTDNFTECRRIPLDWIMKIETGKVAGSSGPFRMVKSSTQQPTCLRVYYIDPAESITDKPSEPYFHVWRAAGTRLFNNMAIPIKTPEESDEYVRAIAEQFRVALELAESPAEVFHLGNLHSKKSRRPPKILSEKNPKFPTFFPDFNQAKGMMRSKLAGAAWNQFGSFRKKIQKKSTSKSVTATKVVNTSHISGNSAFQEHSAVSGLLFTSIPLQATKKADLLPLVHIKKSNSLQLVSHSNTLPIQGEPDHRKSPMFTLDVTESSVQSFQAILSPLNGDINSQLHSASSFASLRGPNGPSIPGTLTLEEHNNALMKTSQSEGMLKQTGVPQGNPGESPKLLRKDAARGSGRFLAITSSSFTKLTNQMQHFGTKMAGARSSGRNAVRVNPFENYRKRIMSSRTKVILL